MIWRMASQIEKSKSASWKEANSLQGDHRLDSTADFSASVLVEPAQSRKEALPALIRQVSILLHDLVVFSRNISIHRKLCAVSAVDRRGGNNIHPCKTALPYKGHFDREEHRGVIPIHAEDQRTRPIVIRWRYHRDGPSEGM